MARWMVISLLGEFELHYSRLDNYDEGRWRIYCDQQTDYELYKRRLEQLGARDVEGSSSIKNEGTHGVIWFRL